MTQCAAIARALETAALRPLARERITIYTDAQAAIRRMDSDKSGPGQGYALEARKHIATIRRRRPGVTIELRWCPAHKGCQEMRRRMNGQRWLRTSQTPTAWNISDLGSTATSQGKDGNPPDHWHT
jgi:hypothetical protein